MDLIRGGSSAFFFARLDASLLFFGSANIRLRRGASRILLASANGLVLALGAYFGFVLAPAQVFLRSLRGFLVGHGKHRDVEDGREFPRADRDGPVAEQRTRLILGAELVRGVVRLFPRVASRGDGVASGAGRVHGVPPRRRESCPAFRDSLLNGIRESPGAGIAVQTRLDLLDVVLDLSLEERASFGEVLLNLRRGELRLGDEQIHLHHLVANLLHGHDELVLDVALEHDLPFLGEHAEVVPGVGAGGHRGTERGIHAVRGGSVKRKNRVVVHVVAVRVGGLGPPAGVCWRVDDELVLGALFPSNEERGRRGGPGLRHGFLSGDGGGDRHHGGLRVNLPVPPAVLLRRAARGGHARGGRDGVGVLGNGRTVDVRVRLGRRQLLGQRVVFVPHPSSLGPRDLERIGGKQHGKEQVRHERDREANHGRVLHVDDVRGEERVGAHRSRGDGPAEERRRAASNRD